MTARTESFLVSVRIAVLTLMFVERTVFIGSENRRKIGPSVYYSSDKCAVSEDAAIGYFWAIG
ncbi:unnamed protein product [Hymenolepis diminuta]|uniref:Uncharacterized protein n=1 Tax=Hymenolepis diminuta TaxID=6216 RepID=A0A564ZA99_HYMDI|nr:unnamed protein product [Hymenolepis diminuta]